MGGVRSFRFEFWLTSLGVVAWAVAVVALLTGRGLAGISNVGLYPLYALGGLLGWGLGNLYVARSRKLGRPVRRLLLPVYMLSAPGVLFVVWATAALDMQLAVPLAPVYAAGVYAVLFLVPLSFARSAR